jgi:hypothetical protein
LLPIAGKAVRSPSAARPGWARQGSVAVEALVAAELTSEAEQLLEAARAAAIDVGTEFLDEAQARISLATGDTERARPLLELVVHEAIARGYRLIEWRARLLQSELLAREDAVAETTRGIATVAAEAEASGAQRVAGEARNLASRLGIPIPSPRRRLSMQASRMSSAAASGS